MDTILTSCTNTRRLLALRRRLQIVLSMGTMLMLLLIGSFVLHAHSVQKARPPQPVWRYGNQYLQCAVYRDWAGAAALCEDESHADAVQSVMQSLIDRYGPLSGYGSEGSGRDLPLAVTKTSQAYQLSFQKQKVGVVMAFMRRPDGKWSVQSLQVGGDPPSTPVQ